MTEDERTELLAQLYNQDEDEAEEAAPKDAITLPAQFRSSKIEVDGKVYHIPTMSYVNALERLVNEQTKAIQALTKSHEDMLKRMGHQPILAAMREKETEINRSVKRLEDNIRTISSNLRSQGSAINEIYAEMSNKIDRNSV